MGTRARDMHPVVLGVLSTPQQEALTELAAGWWGALGPPEAYLLPKVKALVPRQL